jgi:hypothetical protein
MGPSAGPHRHCRHCLAYSTPGNMRSTRCRQLRARRLRCGRAPPRARSFSLLCTSSRPGWRDRAPSLCRAWSQTGLTHQMASACPATSIRPRERNQASRSSEARRAQTRPAVRALSASWQARPACRPQVPAHPRRPAQHLELRRVSHTLFCLVLGAGLGAKFSSRDSLLMCVAGDLHIMSAKTPRTVSITTGSPKHHASAVHTSVFASSKVDNLSGFCRLSGQDYEVFEPFSLVNLVK